MRRSPGIVFRRAFLTLAWGTFHGMLCVIWLFVPASSLAQAAAYLIEPITSEDGLSSNQITALLQDRMGFLWIGTQDGLNRYDGHDFTIYRPEPGNPQSLSHAAINSIYQDRNGLLWIGTPDGLNRFDPVTERFTRYQPDSNDPTSISHRQVWEVREDAQGKLWVSTYGGGLKPPRVRWLDVAASQWHDAQPMTVEGGSLPLSAPGEGFWVAVVVEG